MTLKPKRVIKACQDDEPWVLERWYVEGNDFNFLYHRGAKWVPAQGTGTKFYFGDRWYEPFAIARGYCNFRSMVCMIKRGYPIDDLRNREGRFFAVNWQFGRNSLWVGVLLKYLDERFDEIGDKEALREVLYELHFKESLLTRLLVNASHEEAKASKK